MFPVFFYDHYVKNVGDYVDQSTSISQAASGGGKPDHPTFHISDNLLHSAH